MLHSAPPSRHLVRDRAALLAAVATSVALLGACQPHPQATVTLTATPTHADVAATPAAAPSSASATSAPATPSATPTQHQPDATLADLQNMAIPTDFCTDATPGDRLDHGGWRMNGSLGSAFAELPTGVTPVFVDIDDDGAKEAISAFYCSGGGTSWPQIVVPVRSGGSVVSWTELPTDDAPQQAGQEKPQITALTQTARGLVVDYHGHSTYRALLSTDDGKLLASFDPDFAWNKPRLTAYGFGALKTGMTLDQAENAGLITRVRGRNINGERDVTCDRVEPAGDARDRGISLNTRDGKIAQIVAQDRSVLTLSGAYVDMSEAELRAVYGERIQKKPIGIQMVEESAYVLPADGANLLFIVGNHPDASGPVSMIIANLTDMGENAISDVQINCAHD